MGLTLKHFTLCCEAKMSGKNGRFYFRYKQTAEKCKTIFENWKIKDLQPLPTWCQKEFQSYTTTPFSFNFQFQNSLSNFQPSVHSVP